MYERHSKINLVYNVNYFMFVVPKQE